MHDELVWWIERRLDELVKLERAGNTAKLTSIRANTPNAIPGPLMRTLWRLLLTGRVKSWVRDFDIYRWRDHFKRDGLTTGSYAFAGCPEPQLDEAMLTQLEQAILAGPSRAMFKDDIEPEHWLRIVDREVWLRLAKIDHSCALLSVTGKGRLDALSARYPEWQLAADERDEFPHWMESAWVGDRDPWRTVVSIPRSRRGMLNYLVENPLLGEGKQDDWRKRCGESFQATAYALCHLAKQGVWLSERWRDALQAWLGDAAPAAAIRLAAIRG